MICCSGPSLYLFHGTAAERISDRNCGYVVDVSVPQVDVQPFVVLKFSSQDRILQCTVEQISREI